MKGSQFYNECYWFEKSFASKNTNCNKAGGIVGGISILGEIDVYGKVVFKPPIQS